LKNLQIKLVLDKACSNYFLLFRKLSTHQPSYQQSVIEGYANIHLAKKGLLLDSGKNSQSGIRKKG
jgi:hypothetical protein